MVAYRFNTIGVSDGISMGTDGMSYSLQSREIIADSIETVRTQILSFLSSLLLPACSQPGNSAPRAMSPVGKD